MVNILKKALPTEKYVKFFYKNKFGILRYKVQISNILLLLNFTT